jgi:nitroimidazol reductase NimA-like FMN-containing flavoprotein (pyridoxamine 5'-phosphate oxidase superfamily)
MRRSDREISEIEAIEEIITKADVCRIALANDNTPYIVTMNFGYIKNPGQILYFHCANTGRKLEMIKRNNLVCFEMDTDHQLFGGEMKDGINGCNWGMKYKSVVGYGNISIISEKQAKKTGLDCIMKHYTDEMEYSYNEDILAKTTVLRLDITEITGKKR